MNELSDKSPTPNEMKAEISTLRMQLEELGLDIANCHIDNSRLKAQIKHQSTLIQYYQEKEEPQKGGKK